MSKSDFTRLLSRLEEISGIAEVISNEIDANIDFYDKKDDLHIFLHSAALELGSFIGSINDVKDYIRDQLNN